MMQNPLRYWPGDLNSYINCFILVSKTSASTNSADQFLHVIYQFHQKPNLRYNIRQQDRLNNDFELNTLMLASVKTRSFNT